jgi:FAD dependent monooxygenase
MTKEEFTVVIVGGSIAGLAPAHCLQRANIKHVVLEKEGDPALQIGASIGIMPNGARVMDQIDCIKGLRVTLSLFEAANNIYQDGFSFRSSYPKVISG